MKAALIEMLTVYILILYMFQPAFNEVQSMRNWTVETVLDASIEKAADGDHGRFTPEIINEMKQMLVSIHHYDADDIIFNGTTTITPRGQYIEGTLSVPRGQMWVLPNFFGRDTTGDRTTRYAKQMSEYVIR